MRLKSGLFLPVLLTTTAPVLAGDNVLYGPQPAWVEVTDNARIDTAKPTALALLDIQERIDGQTLTIHVDQAYKLDSPEALTQGGTSTASWLPDKGDLTVHRVEILRGKAVIDVLKGGAKFQVLRREAGLERRQLNGQLTATLAIPGLQVGDVLRIAYSQTLRDQALQGKVQVDTPLLALPAEAGQARTVVSWRDGAPVKWQVGPDADGSATETVRDGWRQVSVAVPLPKREDMPASAPGRFKRNPAIEATDFAGWEEVSRVFAPLYATKGTIAPGSPLAAEVDRIAKVSPDPLTRATLATRLVQDQISYLMNGMAGGNYVPQAPADTWAQRYGDCKAKSLLLLSLLEALGIKAEVVAVSANAGDAVADSLPMPAAFDHVIVRAEIAGKEYWLDGTATGTRAANIADVPPFRHALPIRAEGSTLMAMTPRVPEAPTITVDMVIDQRGGVDMPALFTVKTRFGGYLGSNMGAAIRQASPEQMRKMVDGFAATVFREVTSDLALVTDGKMAFDADGAIADVSVSGIVDGQFWTKDGALRMNLSAMPGDDIAFDHDRTKTAWKSIPVDLGGAGWTTAKIEVLLPENEPGYRMGGRADYDATFAGNTLHRTGALNGSTLTLSEEIKSLGGELPAAEIPVERAKALRAKNTMPFIMAPADAARAWSYGKPQMKARIAALEAAYAKAIARDPKEAAGYLSRASFRASVMDFAFAIADMDKVIAYAPDADNHIQRGRYHRALGQTQAAVDDFRTALELSPSPSTAVVLADALGIAGKTDEALKLLTEYDDMGDEHAAMVQVRADVLALAGRADEGLAEIDALIDEKPGDTSLLNASCWYRARFRTGTDGMMDVCNQAVERAANAAQVLDSRALAWLASGKIDMALADAEAALKLAPQQGATQYLRAFAANALGQPKGKEDLAYFRKVWPGLVGDYARYGLKN